jgi:hypothetical protein
LKKRNKSYVENVKMKIFVKRWGKDFKRPSHPNPLPQSGEGRKMKRFKQ